MRGFFKNLRQVIEKVRIIDRHIEYLIRRHDCVVVPGVGALLCRYEEARFDEDGGRILPPGRRLAFNRWLSDSDGLLVASVAKGEGISFERASELVASEAEQLVGMARHDGEVPVGRLGVLYVAENNELAFEPNEVAGVNGAFYGLMPIAPVSLAERAIASEAEAKRIASAIDAKADRRKSAGRLSVDLRAWRAYASGAVATLAVLVTLALFVASPIRIEKNTQTASIAPVAASHMAITAASEVDRRSAARGVAMLRGNVEGMAMAEPDELSYVSLNVAPVETPEGVERCDEEFNTQAISVGELEPAAVASAESNADVSDEAASSDIGVEPTAPVVRFNAEDPYFVVVASFPSAGQASQYMVEHAREKLGVVEMDGKYRVYAATGRDYASASAMTKRVGRVDAWVCRR